MKRMRVALLPGRSAARSLRTVLLALIFGTALALSAGTQAAGSNKFIPTFLVYYGGGPTLVPGDAARLAKFDLIDIDRFRYRDIGPNTWAAIKALNPAVQIYLYEMGPEAPSHLDGSLPLYLNGLGRYNVSRGHVMGSLNYNNPGLFLLDGAGQRIYSVGFSNPGAGQYWHLMDFGDSAYQTYWTTAVQADIVEQPWVADGVFADNCLTLANAGGYSAASAKYATAAGWSAAMNTFVAAISNGMRAYGQKLWCNRGETRSAVGSAAWVSLDNAAGPPDVLLEEGAFAVEWGSDTQFYPEQDWRRQLDTIRAIRNSKVAAMSHTKLMDGQSGTDNWGKPVSFAQTLWYALGSFLLAKNDELGNAYFMFNGGSGYNRIWWFEEYDRINLGPALDNYRITSVGGVNVYWREFQTGYVYVNPTATDVASIALPQAARLLTRDTLLAAPDLLPLVNNIALAGHHAAFVLKADATPPGAPVPDTTAPSVPEGLTAVVTAATQVNLSWGVSIDNIGVAGYYVYLDDAPLATTTETSFSHTGLTAGATYRYRVSAYDAVPNHSAWTATPVEVTLPVLDSMSPSVSITSPAPYATVAGTITVTASASDNVGVAGVQFKYNGVNLGPEDTSAPFAATVDTRSVPNGLYTLKAVARDAAGNTRTSAPIRIRVRN